MCSDGFVVKNEYQKHHFENGLKHHHQLFMLWNNSIDTTNLFIKFQLGTANLLITQSAGISVHLGCILIGQ